jgi:c-di-GMP-binding flagellar brake protein YcgR
LYPKIGQNILMNLENRSQQSKSLIADIGQEEMLIALPMNTDLIGFLSVGTQLEITYVVEDKKYRFKTKVIGRKKDNIPLFRVVKPLEKDIIRIQMRENFRVNANLKVIIKDTEQNTVNISAGGLLCSCKQDFEIETREELSGTIFFPTADNKVLERVPFKAEVIRTTQVPQAGRINVAMKFTELERGAQSKISQYCFEKQRQELMTARRNRTR